MAVDKYGLPEAGSFKAYSTDQAEFHRELVDFILQHRRQIGGVVPSVGITKPYNRESITSIDDVMALTRQWSIENKERKGGAAFDMPESAPTDTYRQRRFEFLSREEGIRTRAYDDATGLPVTDPSQVKGNITVGIGFNMDAPGNREDFKRATGLSDKDFDEVRAGKKRLTQEQVRKLFDYSVLEAEDFVKKKFKGVDLTEHQRIALVSLAFNNPSLIGPDLTRFVQEGNIAAARDEILNDSNRRKDRGLAGRRYREAEMFVGPMNSAAAMPPFSDYIRNFT